MPAETKHTSGEITAIRRADGESRTLAATLPRLVLEARRIAANVIHGLHGRRRAGAGESFWQYRRFVSGEPSQSVDWRRSARDDHLYVREQEWNQPIQFGFGRTGRHRWCSRPGRPATASLNAP